MIDLRTSESEEERSCPFNLDGTALGVGSVALGTPPRCGEDPGAGPNNPRADEEEERLGEPDPAEVPVASDGEDRVGIEGDL